MADPSATVVFSDQVVSTFETYIERKPADAIFEHNLLLGGLFNSDRMPGVPGDRPANMPSGPRIVREFARELRLPVAYNRSTNTSAFSGADTLNTHIDDVGTTQRAAYAYYTDFVGQPLTESWENSGSAAIYSIFEARLDMATRSLSETIEIDLWSTNLSTVRGTQDAVPGIQHLLDETPTTGTVWGIDRSVYSWQGNQASDAGTVAFATNGLSQMRSMRTSVSGTSGADKMSFIATTPAVWEAYTAEAEGIHQITSGRTAELGFDTANYQGTPVAYSEQCLAGSMFYLNMNYWYLLMPPGTDFKTQTYGSAPNQAMAHLLRLYFALQWGCTRYDRQGVIFNWTDS